MEWILVLHIYAGMFSDSDSVSVASIGVFQYQAQCEQAGKDSSKLVQGTKKELKYVCLARKA